MTINRRMLMAPNGEASAIGQDIGKKIARAYLRIYTAGMQ